MYGAIIQSCHFAHIAAAADRRIQCHTVDDISNHTGTSTSIITSHKAAHIISLSCHTPCGIAVADGFFIMTSHKSANIISCSCHFSCGITVADVAQIIPHKSADIKTVCTSYSRHVSCGIAAADASFTITPHKSANTIPFSCHVSCGIAVADCSFTILSYKTADITACSCHLSCGMAVADGSSTTIPHKAAYIRTVCSRCFHAPCGIAVADCSFTPPHKAAYNSISFHTACDIAVADFFSDKISHKTANFISSVYIHIFQSHIFYHTAAAHISKQPHITTAVCDCHIGNHMVLTVKCAAKLVDICADRRPVACQCDVRTQKHRFARKIIAVIDCISKINQILLCQNHKACPHFDILRDLGRLSAAHVFEGGQLVSGCVFPCTQIAQYFAPRGVKAVGYGVIVQSNAVFAGQSTTTHNITHRHACPAIAV